MSDAQSAPDDPAKPKQDNSLKLYALIIVFLAIALFALLLARQFYTPEPPETVEYNHFTFVKQENTWYTNWQQGDKLYNVPLRFNPYEVEKVPVIGMLNDSFNDNKEIYLVIDVNKTSCEDFKYTTLAVNELSLSLSRAFHKGLRTACWSNASRQCNPAEPENACADKPIISFKTPESCNQLNKSVIVIVPQGSPRIDVAGTCVIIIGQGMDLLKPVDKFLYLWYGIMQ